MSRRSADIFILGEDLQHCVFVRRFLMKSGWNRRRIRHDYCQTGSGEQYVRERYPEELNAYRTRKNNQNAALFVVTDADPQNDVAGRKRQLDEACRDAGIKLRSNDEKVVFIIPKRNIETWFKYLDGQNVDEETDYSRPGQKESNCFPFVDRLAAMCRDKRPQRPSPPSLGDACKEYERFAPN